MTIPVCKVEIWHSGSKLHDATDDVISIDLEMPITDALGKFQVALSEGQGNTFTKYNDISLEDEIYVWLDYDSVGANALFKGVIDGNYAYLSSGGYIRMLQGLDYGEIAQRKHKTKRWESTGASTIISELATDLGFGTGHIEADATSLTVTSPERKYFDLIRDISYIRDKDFYIDASKDLYWFTRQSVGTATTTLTEGDNIISYNLKRDTLKKFNHITVYGVEDDCYPGDRDQYTEQSGAETVSDDGWTCGGGDSQAWETTKRRIGNESYRVYDTGDNQVLAYNDLPGETSLDCAGWKKSAFKELDFYVHFEETTSSYPLYSFEAILYAPDWSNRFAKTYYYLSNDQWHHMVLELGPTKGWSSTGSPDWSDVRTVYFRATFTISGDPNMRIDGLHFNGRPFSAVATDGSADRELIVINNDLQSDSECTDYANALKAFMKDPIYHLDISIPGDITIGRGELINVSIPSRNLSTTFDVINLRHHFSAEPLGFQTNVVTSGLKGIRSMAASANLASLLANLDQKVVLSLRGIQRK